MTNRVLFSKLKSSDTLFPDIFCFYLHGFLKRAVFVSGPIGTLLHACFIYVVCTRKRREFSNKTVYISFTDAHHKNIYLLPNSPALIDLRYERGRVLKALFSPKLVVCFYEAVILARKISPVFPIYSQLKWLNVLAASFQVVAGARLSSVIDRSPCMTLIWGSDHCSVTRTAVLLTDKKKAHHFLPHGACIGSSNAFRNRGIFDLVYALNPFQMAVLKSWEPRLNIQLLTDEFRNKHAEIMHLECEKKTVVFLTQLDLGLGRNEISSNLERYLQRLQPSCSIDVVVKNKGQLKTLSSRVRINTYYIGVSEFSGANPPGGVSCLVFTSGVSLDLMLAGYDLVLCSDNPLVDDEKSRRLLGIPDPLSWIDEFHYFRGINLVDLEKKIASII